MKMISIIVAFATLTSTSAIAKSDQEPPVQLRGIEISSPLILDKKVVAPLKSTSEILTDVEQKLKSELDKTKNAKEKAEAAEIEAKKLAEEKATVTTEIEDLKNRIAQAEAAIAEKQRLKELAAVQVVAVAQTPTMYTRGSVAGNGYAPGYCTYYVKNRRPDIPNNWGNANQWVYSAQASGYSTGATPAAGAIGAQGNHVVYVESVSGDMVTISEMNYGGLWNMNTRTVPASTFYYIY
jgi:surface antigen